MVSDNDTVGWKLGKAIVWNTDYESCLAFIAGQRLMPSIFVWLKSGSRDYILGPCIMRVSDKPSQRHMIVHLLDVFDDLIDILHLIFPD